MQESLKFEYVRVSVCLSQNVDVSKRVCSFALCICTIFDQNAKKTKDANQIVQDRLHHLHDLVERCSKHVNMGYVCMYTAAEIREPVSESVDVRLCR